MAIAPPRRGRSERNRWTVQRGISSVGEKKQAERLRQDQEKAPAASRTPSWKKALKGALGGLSYEKGADALSALKQAGDGLRQVISAPTPTEEQVEALMYVRAMLEPNKLGGADRTFNYGDVSAVTAALLNDTCGLKQEVTGQLCREGKGFQARIAGRGLSGRRGPLAKMARKKVYQEAPGQIGGQLRSGLAEGRIDRATGETVDGMPRDLTFAELRQFEQHVQTLQRMQEEIARKLGVDVTFPGGISQASIDHTLQGKMGVPPGGKLEVLKRTP